MPTQPIYIPGIPAHPIVVPPPAGGEPSDDWQWAFSPAYGWVIVPGGGGGKPQPIPTP